MSNEQIVTIGFCPSWDMIYHVDGLEWGQHKMVDRRQVEPAGKALNVSKALAWMGLPNKAAGLWGDEDYEVMVRNVQGYAGTISIMMTETEGSTRQNITIIDKTHRREVHLRNHCNLPSEHSLTRLRLALESIVNPQSICVFAGSMPDQRFSDLVCGIISECNQRGAKIVIDSSSSIWRRFSDIGRLWLIKPNLAELSELLDRDVPDEPQSIARDARDLLDRVDNVLISRGKKGAVLVTNQGAWSGECSERREAVCTVGCGDYLLAGFIAGMKKQSNYRRALQEALKVAAAKAWGLVENEDWQELESEIRVEVSGVA